MQLTPFHFMGFSAMVYRNCIISFRNNTTSNVQNVRNIFYLISKNLPVTADIQVNSRNPQQNVHQPNSAVWCNTQLIQSSTFYSWHATLVHYPQIDERGTQDGQKAG